MACNRVLIPPEKRSTPPPPKKKNKKIGNLPVLKFPPQPPVLKLFTPPF